MRAHVAIVAQDVTTRAALARHVEEAGFVTTEFRDSPPARGPALRAVWIVERDAEAAAATLIGSWLSARARRRAVIVTWAPSRLRDALIEEDSSIDVLIPPVFPWQVVEALREDEMR